VQALSSEQQKEIQSIFMDPFPIRIRKIYIVHQPWYFSSESRPTHTPACLHPGGCNGLLCRLVTRRCFCDGCVQTFLIVPKIHVCLHPPRPARLLVAAVVWAVAKHFFKRKLTDRVHMLGSDLAALHALVPADVLPPDFGLGGTLAEREGAAIDRFVEAERTAGSIGGFRVPFKVDAAAATVGGPATAAGSAAGIGAGAGAAPAASVPAVAGAGAPF
jgi:hypothetical protein